MNVGEAARPAKFVRTVALPAPAKVPLAPVAGAANVTLAPEITLLKLSVTETTNGLLKAVPTLAD